LSKFGIFLSKIEILLEDGITQVKNFGEKSDIKKYDYEKHDILSHIFKSMIEILSAKFPQKISKKIHSKKTEYKITHAKTPKKINKIFFVLFFQ